MWTNNSMIGGKRGQPRKVTSFEQNIRIGHRKLGDKFFKKKDNFGKIYNIKGHYQKSDFSGWSLHMNFVCHHVRN